jgi:hypothetical protein
MKHRLTHSRLQVGSSKQPLLSFLPSEITSGTLSIPFLSHCCLRKALQNLGHCVVSAYLPSLTRIISHDMSGFQPNPNLAAQLAEARALRAGHQSSGTFHNESSRGGSTRGGSGRAGQTDYNGAGARSHASRQHPVTMSGTRPAAAPFQPVQLRPNQAYPTSQRQRPTNQSNKRYREDDAVQSFFADTSDATRGKVTFYDQNGQGDVVIEVDKNTQTASTSRHIGGQAKPSGRQHYMPDIFHDPAVRSFYDNDEEPVRGAVTFYQDDAPMTTTGTSNGPFLSSGFTSADSARSMWEKEC